MQKVTPVEMLILFVVFMAGTSAMTAVSWYYPDSPEYITYGILVLTIALLFMVAFFVARRKKAT
jgi:hypothetical protein